MVQLGFALWKKNRRLSERHLPALWHVGTARAFEPNSAGGGYARDSLIIAFWQVTEWGWQRCRSISVAAKRRVALFALREQCASRRRATQGCRPTRESNPSGGAGRPMALERQF